MPQQGKGTPKREEAGTSHQGKGTGRRKKVEESKGGRSGAHGQATRSAARLVGELCRRAKKKRREALQKRRSKGDGTIRVRMDDRRNSSVLLDLQVQKGEILCRGQLGARSGPLLEVERIKLVWMQREDRGRDGAAQRGKSAAKRHTVWRTRKRSKGGSKRKGRQENVQNFKRSVIGHRNRESRYI